MPPVPAVEEGRWIEDFTEPFITASRTPWERRGDLAAQIGSNAVGATRLIELVSAYGEEEFGDMADSLLDYVVSDQDYTHRFVISAIYEFPFGKGRRWFASMRDLPEARERVASDMADLAVLDVARCLDPEAHDECLIALRADGVCSTDPHEAASRRTTNCVDAAG